MTARTEPSVGAFDFLGFGKVKQVQLTPEQLMESALAGFTQAQKNLEDAQAEIAIIVAEHEAEIASRQKKLEVANESSSRLGRVAERFKELLS
jgi:hypothetical protein